MQDILHIRRDGLARKALVIFSLTWITVVPIPSNLLGTGTNDYDIIYVDWKIGTDYIQRNALLLEEIIRWVNNNKEPLGGIIQPNVIIGQSMGGLIARWALRDMENKGQNHQTRLFISYDSLHQGANVPLGYQYLARHARNLYV